MYDIEVWRGKETRVEKITANPKQLFYVYNATDKKGTYFFVIIPNTTSCGSVVYKTKSATIDLYPEYTLIAIILYSVILVLFVFGGSYCCFRRECKPQT